MQKIVILVYFVISIFLMPLALAMDASIPTLKVGILDVEQLMDQTGSANRAMNKIRKQYALQEKSLEKEERSLQSDIKKYNKISDKLKPAEIKQWQHKINTKQDKLQQKQSMLQEKIMEAEELETKKIIAIFFGIVSQIAEKDNLDLVLFKDITAYNSIGAEAQDITDEVIRLSSKKTRKKVL